jgi:hypothetical protein
MNTKMSTINTKELFEDKINNIWKNSKFNEIQIKGRGYAVQDKIILNALMFIGLNPSYSESNEENEEPFYNNPQSGTIHKYFKKFQEISKLTKTPWSHTDLLFLRETNQKNIESIYHQKNGVDFIYGQLLISKEIIELSKPKVIIVNNSLARKYLGFEKNNNINVWMGLEFEFDENLGTYRVIKNEKLENIPIFFTSMLTGQRALDKGSFKRLIWHIKFVLEKL